MAIKQWGLLHNKETLSLPLAFTVHYAAVCIGHENTLSPSNYDCAPRIKIFTNTEIEGMTGFNNEDSSKEIYFICIGE